MAMQNEDNDVKANRDQQRMGDGTGSDDALTIGVTQSGSGLTFGHELNNPIRVRSNPIRVRSDIQTRAQQ